MTTASEAIQRAFRETNLIAAGATPNTNQSAEALVLLNSILGATLGFGAGDELSDISVGGDTDEPFGSYAPANARLVLNLSGARTISLHPRPHEGQRIAIADAGASLATSNLTLDGNGRTIESASTVTLSTNGEARQWFYRADTGNWQRLTGLVAADDLPFPPEFDDYFIILLAMRLSPRHGRELGQASTAWLQSQSTQLEARFRRPRPLQDSGSLGLLNQGGLRDEWNLMR